MSVKSAQCQNQPNPPLPTTTDSASPSPRKPIKFLFLVRLLNHRIRGQALGPTSTQLFPLHRLSLQTPRSAPGQKRKNSTSTDEARLYRSCIRRRTQRTAKPPFVYANSEMCNHPSDIHLTSSPLWTSLEQATPLLFPHGTLHHPLNARTQVTNPGVHGGSVGSDR